MTVSLVPVAEKHLATICGWLQDGELRALIGTSSAPTPATQDAWFARQKNPARRTWVITWAGRPTGVGGLFDIDDVARSAELWLYVAESHDRRSGVGRGAVRSMLREAFVTIRLHRVQVRVFGFNQGAVAFFTAMGFYREGVDRQAKHHAGELHDVIRMSMLAPEWLERPGS